MIKAMGFVIMSEERFDEMETLISSLRSFLFVAKIGKRKSAAIDFVSSEIDQYDSKYGGV